MLNAAKSLSSAGNSLSFVADICNTLLVVPVLAFRFLAHDPVKTLILVLAWWYGQITWRENNNKITIYSELLLKTDSITIVQSCSP